MGIVASTLAARASIVNRFGRPLRKRDRFTTRRERFGPRMRRERAASNFVLAAQQSRVEIGPMSLSHCAIALLLIAAREPFAQTAPPPRAHHAVVYDDRARRIIVSGGSTSPDGSRFITYDDLWSWDGARWEKMPVVGPARSSHRVAYDPDNARLLMIGGYDGRRYFGETLSLMSGAWTLLHDDTAFVRGEPGAAYDTKRKRLVVFGGSTGPGKALGDTWEYDGRQWTRVATTGPGPLQAMAMVYDEARSMTILIGGMNAERAMNGKTWGWDGTTWRELSATGPSPRIGSGIAYDAARHEVVLFGGTGSSFTHTGDTWLWNGRAWREAKVAGPSARGMGYMAFDRSRGVTVLFGGRFKFPEDAADTWEWNGSSWRRVP